MSYGVFIAQEGKSLGTDPPGYRSDTPRLQVALKPKPRHLQIIDDLVGGTALATAGPQVDETLLEIKHKLPYTPEALAYFYVKSKSGDSVSLPAGRYSGGIYFYSGSSGAFVDGIYIGADAKNVYIKHSISVFGGSPPQTSLAPDYIFRVKLYILSNDSHVPAWDFYSESL